jgi:hypothetical protein
MYFDKVYNLEISHYFSTILSMVIATMSIMDHCPWSIIPNIITGGSISLGSSFMAVHLCPIHH